jgi:NADH:ubiquinone oxidoreductase subunit 4 (subunit M)
VPGTSSFVGEFLVLLGSFQVNTLSTVLAALGMVLGAAYALWLCNRLVYGMVKPWSMPRASDLSRREWWTLAPCVGGILWMGIYPEPFLDTLHWSVAQVVLHGTP